MFLTKLKKKNEEIQDKFLRTVRLKPQQEPAQQKVRIRPTAQETYQDPFKVGAQGQQRIAEAIIPPVANKVRVRDVFREATQIPTKVAGSVLQESIRGIARLGLEAAQKTNPNWEGGFRNVPLGVGRVNTFSDTKENKIARGDGKLLSNLHYGANVGMAALDATGAGQLLTKGLRAAGKSAPVMKLLPRISDSLQKTGPMQVPMSGTLAGPSAKGYNDLPQSPFLYRGKVVKEVSDDGVSYNYGGVAPTLKKGETFHGKVPDFIQNHPAYELYPELKNAGLQIKPVDRAVDTGVGSYDQYENLLKLKVNQKDPYYDLTQIVNRNTPLHEMQHGVAKFEPNVPQGTSPTAFMTQKDLDTFDDFRGMRMKLDTMDAQLTELAAKGQRDTPLFKKIQSEGSEIYTRLDLAYEQYLDNSGEVASNTTALRGPLNDWQRARQPFNDNLVAANVDQVHDLRSTNGLMKNPESQADDFRLPKSNDDYFDDDFDQMRQWEWDQGVGEEVPLLPNHSVMGRKGAPTDTADEMLSNIRLTPQKDPSKLAPILRVARSGGAELKSMGEAGGRLDKALTESKIMKDNVTGFYRNWLNKATQGIKKADEAEVAEVLRGRSAGSTDAIKEAARQVREITQHIRTNANELGLKVPEKENYFPQIWGRGWELSAYRKEKAIEHLMNSGQAETPEYAEELLESFYDSAKGQKSGHLEKPRTADLPAEFTENSMKAMQAYIHEAAQRFTDIQYFGKRNERLDAMLGQIERQGGDPVEARKIVEQVLGRENDTTMKKVADVTTGAATITTLSTSFIKNLTQIGNNFITAGVIPTMKGAARFAKNNIVGDGIDSLTTRANVFDEAIIFNEAGIKDPKEWAEKSMWAFGKVEQLLRGISAETGAIHAQRMFDKAAKGNRGAKAAKRALERLHLSEEYFVDGKLTRDGAVRAANQFSELTQFKIDAQNTPRLWRTPVGRIVSQWQAFNYRQTQLMWDSVVKEAVKGNVMPMVRAALVAPALSIPAIAGARIIRGEDPQEGDADWLDYYQGVTGIPGSLKENYDYTSEFLGRDDNSDFSKAMKVTGAVGGPAVSIASDVAVGVEEAIGGEEDKPYLKLKREATEKIPYAGPALKNTFLKYDSQEKEKEPGYYEGFTGQVREVLETPSKFAVGVINKMFGSEYAPKVSRVIDGDTFVLDNGQRVRLLGVDTPEMGTPGGEAAKNNLANMLLGKDVDVRFEVNSKDSDGPKARLLGKVIVDGQVVNDVLMEDGLAIQMSRPANSDDINVYTDKQKAAQEQGKGFWGDPNAKIRLKTDGYGEDPGFFTKLGTKKLGETAGEGYDANFDEKSIEKNFKGLTAEQARREVNDPEGDLTDDDLLVYRAMGDNFTDYFLGGKSNPAESFQGATLDDKLADAFNKTGSSQINTKMAEVYSATNYTAKEKEMLYKKMGFTKDEAGRATLRIVKGRGMEDASPIISDYMRKNGFTEELAKKLIEDKTLTSPQVKDMLGQDVITQEEHDALQALIGGSGSSKKKSGGSSGGSSSGKKVTLKASAIKAPTITITNPFEGTSDFVTTTKTGKPSAKLSKFKGLHVKIADPSYVSKQPEFDKIKVKFK